MFQSCTILVGIIWIPDPINPKLNKMLFCGLLWRILVGLIITSEMEILKGPNLIKECDIGISKFYTILIHPYH